MEKEHAGTSKYLDAEVNALAKQSTQAFVWCLIHVFLLLTFMTPLNILTINFIMIPVVVMYTRLELKAFILTYAISLAAVFALTGSFGPFLILLSLFFLLPSVVIGWAYKKQSPARTTFVAGTISLLSEFLLVLTISYAAGFRPMDRLRDLLYDSINSLPVMLKNTVNQGQLDLAVHYFMQLIPLFLISASIYYVFITHGISRWLLRKTGVIVPGLPPVRNWMLPRSFVWYFLIVTVLDYFISIESSSVISMFVWNLLPILTMAFAIQAIGFFFFVAHAKKWNKVLPILAIVGMILFFPLVYLYCILGVLDVLLPIRKRIAG